MDRSLTVWLSGPNDSRSARESGGSNPGRQEDLVRVRDKKRCLEKGGEGQMEKKEEKSRDDERRKGK